MGNAFTHSWRFEAWRWNAVRLQGEPCDHSAGNAFGRAGVRIGDTIYVVANAHGVMRLAGKMRVDEFVGQREAERRLGYRLWKAREHAMSTHGTKLHFGREVPNDVVRRLRFGHDAKPLKLSRSGYLDPQAFRNVRMLTADSARLLDQLLRETERRGPKRSPLLLPEEFADDQRVPAGALKRITVNRFERVEEARRACIRHHGCRCTVCDVLLSDVYGEIGDGYIHVHHRTSVMRLPKNYRIDPISELCPVCPNCHAMLHQNDPPITVEKLRRIVAARRKQ